MGKAPSLHCSPVDPRAKLLHRLGFSQPSAETPHRTKQQPKHVLRTASVSRSIIGSIVPIRQPLNDATGERIISTQLQQRSRIQFNNDVMVVQIPSHHEYSNRIKKFLWHSGHEIAQNAQRNRVEYASEGWDWHTVLEDDDMFVDASTGELVHPIWFDDDDVMDMSDAESTSSSTEEPDNFNGDPQPPLIRINSFAVGLDKLSE